jgi:DNA-binding transcriptional MerR regulator
MRKNQVQKYSIGNVAKITGATKKQIRNWEANGHIPKADRVQYGDRAYRRFDLKQVELISKIKDLRDEGYTLPAAAEKAKVKG